MDIITYALCKKLVSSSATGIKKIELVSDSNKYNLKFTLGDDSVTTVELPVKTDCINFKHVSSLPISNISETTVYIVPKNNLPTNDAFYQYMYVGGAWELIGSSGAPIATETEVGLVKPDGITISVDGTGTISVKENGIKGYIDNYLNDSNNDLDDSDIDGLF